MKNFVKTLLFSLLITLVTAMIPRREQPLHVSDFRSEAFMFCGGYDSEDYYYFNLFSQEVIDAPRYFPFLLSYDNWFYETPSQKAEKNENIEAWSEYLGIPYEQAYYLVFQSDRADLRNLTKGVTITDPQLSFATPDFVTRHRQSLLYLAYAKYLEPYMAVENSQEYWNGKPSKTVADLNYDQVINVLEKSWHAETDKELKLRYGYQLVRFAHYNRNFETAVTYFNQYVESLHYKNIMYYYALDQKAGAERGLGRSMDAFNDFFTFFHQTKNHKSQAFSSLQSIFDLDYKALLNEARTEDEKNDIYLILGYTSFNNPLASLEHIIATTPDAVQAKVLMARTVNQLERGILNRNFYCPYDHPDCAEDLPDHRLPQGPKDDYTLKYLLKAIHIGKSLVQNAQVADKDFWNLTTAYLHFLNKEYDLAKEYLKPVKGYTQAIKDQKDLLKLIIDLTTQPVISRDYEEVLMTDYKRFLNDQSSLGIPAYIRNILANRYYLQGAYAKAFLIRDGIGGVASGQNLELAQAILAFYNQSEKNAFEKMLVAEMTKSTKDIPGYLNQIIGSLYLKEGQYGKALSAFDKVPDSFSLNSYTQPGSYNGYKNIPSLIFGYNRFECFHCQDQEVMQLDNPDFDFIPSSMNKKELTNVLLKLQKLASQNGEMSAKANFLLANFHYNTSKIGYYREVLMMEMTNHYLSSKYSIYTETPMFDYPYFYNSRQYQDNFDTALRYLKKAMATAHEEELMAKILFVAQECEQGKYYQTGAQSPASPQPYFEQLAKYSQTDFYQEARSNCLYFSDYLNH